MLRSIASGLRCVGALVLVVGCGDLARVNPYDPAAPFEISLAGPSLVQVGDTVSFTAEITPDWAPPGGAEWSSLDTRVLFPLGGGRYVARGGGTTTIGVRFGPRFQTREISVESRAPTISGLSPGSAHSDTGQISLSVAGTQFHTGTVVTWDGAARPTQFVSSTRVVVELSAPDIASIGSHAVVAINGPPGGGSSPPVVFQSLPPLPRIRSLSRGSATAGAGPFTLSVFGDHLTPQSVVRWNGEDRPTTFLSSSTVTASISAANLAAGGVAEITIAQFGDISAPMPFVVLAGSPALTSLISLDLASRAIVYDSTRSRLYAAVPASSTIHPGSVAIIDPLTGAVVSSIPLGADPGFMVLSDDHRYLHVALVDVGAVARVDLAAGSKDSQFGLGTHLACGAYFARDMVALAGQPTTIAVVRSVVGCFGSNTAVFDEGVLRPRVASVGGSYPDQITASGRPDRLYGHSQEDGGPLVLTTDAGGVTRATTGSGLFPSNVPTEIEYDAGYLFSSRGVVVDPVRITRVAEIQASGTVLPDVRKGRVHFFAGVTLRTFHPFVADLIGSVSIAEASGATGMARWGIDGLALRRDDRIVLVRSPLIGP